MNQKLKKMKYLVRFLPDRFYLTLYYLAKQKRFPDLRNPKRFSEKIQYLKLYDQNPEHTIAVDKYLAKEYVGNILGEKYITPTLGVWEAFDQIDFDQLPDQFVLKCNHDSQGLVIVQDKIKLDKEKARQELEAALQYNYYYISREWPYKNVKPLILAEEYLENGKEGLHDYKVWCFNGKVEYIQYITGRIGETYEVFYDRKWMKQDFSYHNPLYRKEVAKPACLDELIEAAEKLAVNMPFLRADFYILETGEIKFGEMTFFPMGGLDRWHPDEMDLKLGQMINLNYGK